jgi:hypothetical protein
MYSYPSFLNDKTRTAAHAVAWKSSGGGSAWHLIDNRPASVVQKQQVDALNNRQTAGAPIQKAENRTGLPDQLKSGIENLSGYSLDDVKVHYNSDKPAQLQAHAYAQGTEIHIAPGQEKHLPHEAWHVVQQKQGRVKPTLQMKGGVNINDDVGLEKEADTMGEKALRVKEQIKEKIIKVVANSAAQMKNIQKLSYIYFASKSIQNKDNDNGFQENNLDIKGERIKTGFVKNSNDFVSAVVQPKLYVIGEMHSDTDLRLEQEKEFCAENYGPQFFLEHEYKLPGTRITADPRALLGMRAAIIPLYGTPGFLKGSTTMSVKELDENAKFISDKIVEALYQLEQLKKNPDQRFQFENERLKAINPKLKALDVAIMGFRLVVSKKEKITDESTKIQERYDELRRSIIILHNVTESHALRTKRELDKSRSAAMANALIATGEKANGVWKVGDDHIPEIREVIEEEEDKLLPQVISEKVFNSIFLPWFKIKYKVKYDEIYSEKSKTLEENSKT